MHALGLSRLASQALMHPTGVPDESRGPMSCEGHPGPRSTGHEATEQLLAEGMIAIGRLNPSTRDTTPPRPQQHASQSGPGVREGGGGGDEKNKPAPS